MRRVTFIKIIVLVVFIFVYDILDRFIGSIIANDLAMKQMQSTVDSSIWIQLYTYFSNYSFLFFIVVALLLFSKEIVNFINSKKGR